jgi:hypothetical protein
LFITLTAAHTSETVLEPFLDALGDAMGLVYEGSPWTRFRRSCGYIGSIKGLEITRGGTWVAPALPFAVVLRAGRRERGASLC